MTAIGLLHKGMNRRPAAEIRGWHKPRFHISVPLQMTISPRRIQPPIQPPAGSISRRTAAEESTGQALVVAFQALVTRCVARAVVPSKSIRSFIPFVRMQGFHFQDFQVTERNVTSTRNREVGGSNPSRSTHLGR